MDTGTSKNSYSLRNKNIWMFAKLEAKVILCDSENYFTQLKGHLPESGSVKDRNIKIE